MFKRNAIRVHLVDQVREAIARNEYETPEKLDAAMGGLIYDAIAQQQDDEPLVILGQGDFERRIYPTDI